MLFLVWESDELCFNARTVSWTSTLNLTIKQKISIIRDQFEVCTPYLTTLSDPVRQKILLILAESGTDGMDVQDITAKISLSRSQSA